MARQLAYTVFVPDEHGEVTKFGPDDDVPAWAAKLIGAHCYVASDEGDEGDVDYASWTRAALEAEVAKRNNDRDDDDQVEVDPPGNKPELVAALEADDLAQG